MTPDFPCSLVGAVSGRRPVYFLPHRLSSFQLESLGSNRRHSRWRTVSGHRVPLWLFPWHDSGTATEGVPCSRTTRMYQGIPCRPSSTRICGNGLVSRSLYSYNRRWMWAFPLVPCHLRLASPLLSPMEVHMVLGFAPSQQELSAEIVDFSHCHVCRIYHLGYFCFPDRYS